MKLFVWAILICSTIMALICGCGGSKSSGGGTPSSGGGTPSGGGNTTGSGITASFKQGTFWEFLWSIESTTSAMGSAPSYSTDSGRYIVTLGVPVTIQNVQVYPLSVTGSTGKAPTDFKPRWTHIGVSNGMLVGSTDGINIASILDASKSTMTGGGFITRFSATETIKVSTGNFSGNYNQLSSINASHSSSDGGCETILGSTICSDSQTTFSETEYYKDGIGPLGLKRSMSYSSSGGGFYSDHSITHVVELIGTSLIPADGTTFKPPPWSEVAPLRTPRSGHIAAEYNNKIYLFGGGTTSVEVYDPVSNTWAAGATMPDSSSYAVAKTIGSKIYLMPTSANPVLIYDPGLNTWSRGAIETSLSGDPSMGGDVWTGGTPVDTYILTVTPNGYNKGMLKIFAYRAGNNTLLYGNDLTSYTDHRWGAVTVVGNSLYLIGGYRQDLSQKVFDNTLRYDISAKIWTQGVGKLNVPRYEAKAVNFNGEAVVLGGETVVKELSDVEAYSETTKTWRKLSSMLKARSHFAAVVLNGKIYAIGGMSGGNKLNNVEVYSP